MQIYMHCVGLPSPSPAEETAARPVTHIEDGQQRPQLSGLQHRALRSVPRAALSDRSLDVLLLIEPRKRKNELTITLRSSVRVTWGVAQWGRKTSRRVASGIEVLIIKCRIDYRDIADISNIVWGREHGACLISRVEVAWRSSGGTSQHARSWYHVVCRTACVHV